MSELPEKRVKSFSILEETEEDIAFGFIFEDGTDAIYIIPRENLVNILDQIQKQLKELD